MKTNKKVNSNVSLQQMIGSGLLIEIGYNCRTVETSHCSYICFRRIKKDKNMKIINQISQITPT